MSGTTVRSLTHDERAEMSALLLELHAHTDKCDTCSFAFVQSDRCEVGRKLYARWEAWIAG